MLAHPLVPPLVPEVSRNNRHCRGTAVGGFQDGSIVANEDPRCTLVEGSIVEQANQDMDSYDEDWPHHP